MHVVVLYSIGALDLCQIIADMRQLHLKILILIYFKGTVSHAM